MYKATFERVVQGFTKDRYASEFAVAREDYFRRTGKVFEDEPIFESRMTSLLEWYLIDRCLWDTGVPPIRLHRLIHDAELGEKERKMLSYLEASVHSLYLVVSLDREKCAVRDLLYGTESVVTNRDHFPGVRKGDILDARLVRIDDKAIFTEALWIHPVDASEFIQHEARQRVQPTTDARDRFLFDLSYMKLKRDRYAHVTAKEIYDWEIFKKDRQEAA
jgi:hypothetical protein